MLGALTKSCGNLIFFFVLESVLVKAESVFFRPMHVVGISTSIVPCHGPFDERTLFIFSYIHLVLLYADWIHQSELLMCIARCMAIRNEFQEL